MVFSLDSPCLAAVPSLDHLHPPAAQIGATNLVSAIGKFDPWPPQVWVNDPAIRFQATTNKGEFSVEIGAKATVGPHLVRVFNEEGSAKPRFFVVERETQTRETEPNDEFANPQVIANLPAVINGRLDKSGDVDSFGVTLAAGQTLVASVEAYVLESPLDAMIRVTDVRGVEQTWNHDGRTFDPFVTFTARDAGRYVVQVMGFPYPATSEIRFTGSDKCVYRLRLSGGPFLSHTLPLGVSRAGRTALHLEGWNLARGVSSETEFECKSLEPGTDSVKFGVAAAENTLTLPVCDGPEAIESEPNDNAAQANPLGVPGAMTGCIERAGDEDRFLVTAKKGQRFQFSVQSAALGFPLDAWLKVEDTNGTQLARNDDKGGADPELDWSAPSDGNFVVAVGNLLHRGGSNHLYRLAVAQPKPDFTASAAEHSLVIKPGTTNDLKVTVNRLNSFTNQIAVRATGLPEGVSMTSLDVPEKGGEMTLKLVAATNAPPHNGVFRIVAASGGTERAAAFSFVSKSENNGVPGGYRELVIPETEQLWLTVRTVAEKDKAAK